MQIPYYPATYYVIDTTCTTVDVVSGACVTTPDGKKLKRYEIKTGVTFPSGRTYAAELQNFANWFTYYRKRKLMLAGAMGSGAVAGARRARRHRQVQCHLRP